SARSAGRRPRTGSGSLAGRAGPALARRAARHNEGSGNLVAARASSCGSPRRSGWEASLDGARENGIYTGVFMKRLHGAVVGYGFIRDKGHAAAYRQRPDVQIDAIADIAPERRAVAAAAWPQARIYESHEALLSAEAGQLDFVDVATPPSDHAAIAHAAFDAG